MTVKLIQHKARLPKAMRLLTYSNKNMHSYV